jgi:hypothetical protein
MTIEIEAGASQSQFSMKPLVVHAFFGGQPWNGRLSTTDVDLSHAPECQRVRIGIAACLRNRCLRVRISPLAPAVLWFPMLSSEIREEP